MREFIQPPQMLPLERRRWNPLEHFSGILGTLTILLAILYIGALLLSRTAGFADIVRGQLEKHIGLEFKVGSSALTPSFALVLEDVKGTVPKNSLKAGVAAKRVVISWNWSKLLFGGDPLRELHAENCDLHFALDAAGRWQPAQFNQISDWFAGKFQFDLNRYTSIVTRAAATNSVPEDELDLFAEQRVEMKDALVHWQVIADSEIARADGADLVSTRVKLPGRDITHFLLHFHKADTAQGFHAAEKKMELIELGGREIWIEGGPTNITGAAARPVVKPLEPRRVPVQPPPDATRVAPRIPTNAVEKPSPLQPLRSGSPDPGPEE